MSQKKRFYKTRNRLKNNHDIRLDVEMETDFGNFTLRQLNDYCAATAKNEKWTNDFLDQTEELKPVKLTLPVYMKTATGLTISWWEN